MDTGETQRCRKIVLKVDIEGNMEAARKNKPGDFQRRVKYGSNSGLERGVHIYTAGRLVLSLLFQLVSEEAYLANQSPRARPSSAWRPGCTQEWQHWAALNHQ